MSTKKNVQITIDISDEILTKPQNEIKHAFETQILPVILRGLAEKERGSNQKKPVKIDLTIEGSGGQTDGKGTWNVKGAVTIHF